MSEPITSDRDVEVLQNGVGLVNVVSRTTASSQDLSSAEIREGCRRLVEKLQLLQVFTVIVLIETNFSHLSPALMESQFGSLFAVKCYPGRTKNATFASVAKTFNKLLV